MWCSCFIMFLDRVSHVALKFCLTLTVLVFLCALILPLHSFSLHHVISMSFVAIHVFSLLVCFLSSQCFQMRLINLTFKGIKIKKIPSATFVV